MIASEALMLRASALKTILLVEGTSDDKLLGSFVDKAEYDVVIAYGKVNLLEALEILRRKDAEGIVCLVDADFSRIDGAVIADKDIVVTEFHDLEVSLFHSSAFDRVLSELGSRRN